MSDPEHDRALLRALAGDDADAAAAFLSRFGELLLAFLVRATRDGLLGIDLWHETLAETRRRCQWDGPDQASVGAWLLDLAAGAVHDSVERGQVVTDARARVATPVATVREGDVDEALALLESRPEREARDPEAARRFETLMSAMPSPHALRRLRPSSLVRLETADDRSSGDAP